MLSLTVADFYLTLEPAIPLELKRQLTYYQRTLGRDPKARWRKKAGGQTRHLYTEETGLIQDDGSLGDRLITSPGFLKRVRVFLEENNLEYQLQDLRTPAPGLDLEFLDKLLADFRLSQTEATAALLSSLGGRASAPTGWGKTRLMAAILGGYKREDWYARKTPLSVVVTPGLDLIPKNLKELQELLPHREFGIVCTGKDKPSPDITLVTPDSLHKLDCENVGLLVYDEVHTLTEDRADQVSACKRAIKFGISASLEGRFDGSDKLTEGVFGELLFECSYTRAVEEGAVVPIEVLWVMAPMPPHITDPYQWQIREQDREVSYRYGLWRNEALHQALGRLWREFDGDAQLLMIADKLEHVSSVLPFLTPDTVQVHAQSSEMTRNKSRFLNIKQVSSKERRRIYDELYNNRIKRVISTGIYKQGVNFPGVAAVFNISGGGSKIAAQQIPGRASRRSQGKEVGVIVDVWFGWDRIEVEDPDSVKKTLKDGHLLRDCKARQKVYAKQQFPQTFLEG